MRPAWRAIPRKGEQRDRASARRFARYPTPMERNITIHELGRHAFWSGDPDNIYCETCWALEQALRVDDSASAPAGAVRDTEEPG